MKQKKMKSISRSSLEQNGLCSLSHSQSVTRDTLIACLAGEGLTEGEGEVQIKGAAATTIEQIMSHRGENQSLKLQKEKL